MKAVTLEDYKQRLLRVLVYIQQNLERDLPLDELARVAHFSPYHFHRIFTGMVGETLRGHIRRIRLERAAARLKHTNRPVTDIAFEAGYEAHEAFTRAFRAMTGLPPSEFRNQCRAQLGDSSPSGVHYHAGGPLGDFHLYESGGASMEVEIKQLDPMRVAFMRHVGPYHECGPVWDAFLTEMGAQGWLGCEPMLIGICHDDPAVTPDARIRYDACLPVDGSFEPEGAIGVQTISGGRYAVTTHLGPYDKFDETYAKLCGQWIPRNGHVFRSAPSFQVYLNDPDSTELEDLLTDIYVPLEDA